MSRPKVGIVGGGVVGKAMKKMCGNDAITYDPFIPECESVSQDDINKCDIAFVCVPTPMKRDGSCDTSIVESSVGWLKTPLIVIRSTITPGTTDKIRVTGKHVVFQPEYLGETPSHVFIDMGTRPFAVLGGSREDTSAVADFYKNYYNAYIQFHFVDAITAEVCKYMENAFYALKVTFVNEFYDIAKAHGVDFNVLREVWLADTRISRDHSLVYPKSRGFSGKCLPKDCNAIVKSSEQRGYVPKLMKACLALNDEFQARIQEPRPQGAGIAQPLNFET